MPARRRKYIQFEADGTNHVLGAKTRQRLIGPSVLPKDIEEAIDKIANRSRYRAYTDEKGITYYPWAWVKFYLLKVVTGQDDKAIAKFIGGPQGKQAIEYQDEAPELIRQKVESGSIRVKALLDCLRHNEAQRGAEPLTGLLGTAAQQFRKARFWGLPPR